MDSSAKTLMLNESLCMFRRTCGVIMALLGVICLYPTTVRAQEVGAPETISSFTTTLTLDRGGRLFVQEDIVYDFGGQERHGLVRDLPVAYKKNPLLLHVLRTEIQDVTVDGQPVPYARARQGDDIVLTIGDPSKIVRGKHTYRISYAVDRALNRVDNEVELYWNAIGTGWVVPIASSSVVVRLPKEAGNAARFRCFVGMLGSTSTCAQGVRDGALLRASSPHELVAGEAFTVVVRVPSDSIRDYSWQRRFIWFMQDNYLVVSPLLCALLCCIVWYLWGRDPSLKRALIAQYEPPQGLNALEVGTMIDQHVDERDIAAIFIEWAQKGFIAVKESVDGKGFDLVKRKNDVAFGTAEEERLFKALFARADVYHPAPDAAVLVALNDLKNATYQRLVKRGLFTVHPEFMRMAFLGAGLAVGFGGGFIFSSVVYPSGLYSAVAFVLMLINGAIIAFTGRFMPRVTPQGALVVEHARGFKMFLSVTEAARLAFFNAPDKKPEQFDLYLPMALALGVEKEWAAQFAAMHIQPPSWFESATTNTFTSIVFAERISGLAKDVHTSMTSVRNASSGSGWSSGSAGGGFGGGGGKSW